MKSVEFCYWLQGLFEISDIKELNEKQVNIIKKHLNLVFKHEIDPSYGDENHLNVLDMIHNSNGEHLRC